MASSGLSSEDIDTSIVSLASRTPRPPHGVPEEEAVPMDADDDTEATDEQRTMGVPI